MTQKNEMPCLTADSADLLFAYVDGSLDRPAAAALEAHAAVCTPCRELVEGQQALWRTMDTWEAPDLSLDFNRNLHAFIGERTQNRGWRAALVSSWSTWLGSALNPKNLLVPAGVMALLVAGVLVFEHPARVPVAVAPAMAPASEQKAGVEENEVRQMERVFDDLDALDTLDAALKSEAGEKL